MRHNVDVKINFLPALYVVTDCELRYQAFKKLSHANMNV